MKRIPVFVIEEDNDKQKNISLLPCGLEFRQQHRFGCEICNEKSQFLVCWLQDVVRLLITLAFAAHV